MKALSEIGCQACDTWFVGDHPVNDVLGAAAVGLRGIWLTGVFPWLSDQAERRWQMTTLGELVELVHGERQSTT